MLSRKKVNRRQFLKKAAGATAGALIFPYIIPSSAMGKGGAISPSNRIVMACIGTGGQGRANLSAFINNPDVQIIATCDVDKQNLQLATNMVNEKYGNKDCRTYGDFRELLAKEKTDAAAICTPDHWHGLISIAAAKAGNDIYCEKPLTNTISEGRAVCEAVKRYGCVFQTGSHERSNAKGRYACELVLNGRIGKLHTIRVNMPNTDSHHLTMLAENKAQPVMPIPQELDYDMWLGPTPYRPYTKYRSHFFWRFIFDYGGGEMTDRGAHIIDLGQLGNGSDRTGPVEISCQGKAPRDGIFDTFFEYSFTCNYANGVKLIGSSDSPRGLKFEGSDGWVFIHIHGCDLEASSKSLLKEFIAPGEIHLGRSPEHHRDFLDAIRTRNFETMAPAEIGHRTASICHLINIAMLTGKELKWDPVKEQITNDAMADRMVSRPMRSPWRV